MNEKIWDESYLSTFSCYIKTYVIWNMHLLVFELKWNCAASSGQNDRNFF